MIHFHSIAMCDDQRASTKEGLVFVELSTHEDSAETARFLCGPPITSRPPADWNSKTRTT